MKEKALLYCEGQLGKSDGKTANGLIRYSRRYEVLCVIDSTKAGMDSGKVLDGAENGILIYQDVADALDHLLEAPDYFIYGLAPKEPILGVGERQVLLNAISNKMSIVIGLHEFISDDCEFITHAKKHGVKLYDMRKPLSNRYLHIFSGAISKVKTPKIAIFGTDCAVGKRTTAMELIKALNATGIRTSFIGTGQTALIQGEKYGIALDAIPGEFMIGEMENAVIQAEIHEKPDLIVIEGQSSLTHPAFISSCAIIKGGKPDAFILQHPPKRKYREDFNYLLMPALKDEISFIEDFSNGKVIAITLNNEGINLEETNKTIEVYEEEYQLPVTDVLRKDCSKLVEAIIKQFPEIRKKIKIN